MNEMLYFRLPPDVRQDHYVESTVFGIAMNGNEVRLYVAWLVNWLVDKDDDDDYKYDGQTFYMADVECFVLRRPDDLQYFRRTVRNIFDWAKTDRLKDYRRALKVVVDDKLKEEAEKEKQEA